MTLDELERKLEGVPTGLLKKLVARRERKCLKLRKGMK